VTIANASAKIVRPLTSSAVKASPFLSSALSRTTSINAPMLSSQRSRASGLFGAPACRQRYRFAVGCVEIVQRQIPKFFALGKLSFRLERVREVNDGIQRRHYLRAGRVFFDCGENVGVVHAEPLARNRRSQARVQQRRVFPLVGRNLKPAREAFGDQALRRVQTRQIVEQSGEASLCRVDAVPPGQQLGPARNPDTVRVAVLLTDMVANLAGEL